MYYLPELCGLTMLSAVMGTTDTEPGAAEPPPPWPVWNRLEPMAPTGAEGGACPAGTDVDDESFSWKGGCPTTEAGV